MAQNKTQMKKKKTMVMVKLFADLNVCLSGKNITFFLLFYSVQPPFKLKALIPITR